MCQTQTLAGLGADATGGFGEKEPWIRAEMGQDA